MRVALIDKCPSNANYAKYLEGIAFDQYHLCSRKLAKVFKKDVNIEINLDDYDRVILIGSEALKYYTSVTSVTDHAGTLVDGKFIPLINPAMLVFKPEAKPAFERSVEQLKRILAGEGLVDASGEFFGIQDSDEALAYLEQVDELAKEAGRIAVDTECSSLYPRDGYVLGISISGAPRTGAYIDSDCIDERVWNKFQELFLKYKVVFHNSKFDIKMLAYHFDFKFREDYEDTLLMHYMLDETQGTHGLKSLALKYTKYGDYDRALEEFKQDYCRKNKILQSDFTYDLIPFDIISQYAAIDTAVTIELFDFFSPIMRKNPKITKVYEQLMIPGSTALMKMEESGIPFCKDRLAFAKVTLEHSIEEAAREVFASEAVKNLEKITGNVFNPNSVVQLRTLLFDVLNLESPLNKTTGTGALSTDAEVLESMKDQHPIVEKILTLRKLNKIKNTYVDKIIPEIDADGQVRTGFNLTSTTSGRLSSSGKFNAQQIIRDEPRIKGSIKARPGYVIVSQDLATAEMYYASVLSKDKRLQNIFVEGGDFHGAIARQVFNLPCEVKDVKDLFPVERQAAKAVSFGILYGSGALKVSETVSKQSKTLFSKREAQDVIDQYFDTFSTLKQWLKDCKDLIMAQGFCYTSFGRKRRLKNVFSADKAIASHEVRSGINAMVQALASDINLLACIDSIKEIERRGLDARIFMMVHDSIVAEVHESCVEEYKELLRRNTQKDRGFSIPGTPIGVDQEVGPDYSFGAFDEAFGEEFARYIKDPVSYIPFAKG